MNKDELLTKEDLNIDNFYSLIDELNSLCIENIKLKEKNIKTYATKELIEELRKRKGIKSIEVNEIDSATILIVTN